MNKICQGEYIPYSRKLLWEKTFVNWLKKDFFMEKLSPQNLGAGRLLVAPVSNPQKFSPNSHKTSNLIKFSPSKVFR